MESDSDETIILDSENEQEVMDFEEAPVLHFGQVELSSIMALHDGIVNVASTIREEYPTIRIEEQDESSESVPVVAENSEDSRSQSPSLLTTNRDQNESSDIPVKEEVSSCSDTKERPPRKRRHSDDEADDDGKTCPICLDTWANLGEHRICSLKCGHLFGECCIVRWFSTQKKKSCPTCKKKAVKSDIRHIYAKKLIAMDASELVNIKIQLDDATQEKNRIQIELTKAICREHSIMQQVEDLKKKVQYLDSALEVKRQISQSQASSNSGHSAADTVRLYMDKSLEISKDAGCRVLDHCSSHDLLMVSTRSPSNLFPGYGVRKINISTYRPTAFIPLHTKPIRDIRFHPENAWLLSVSLDNVIKIIDTQSNMPISIFTSGNEPLWSCCWDVNNSYILYVGKQQGSVAKFDMRQMTRPVCTLEVPGDMSPVVSVASIAAKSSSAVPSGGIISCKLNSVWVFENVSDEYVRHPLPMEGPFISMMYQNKERQLLVSTRSNLRVPYSRHHFCNIEKGNSDNLLCNTVHCFPGGSTQKLLSRSCIVANKSSYYVAAHEETNKTVSLWSVSSGHKAGSLPARDDVLDLCGVSTGTANFLVALTERRVEFFKFA